LNAAVENAIFIYSEKQVQREMVMKKAFTLAEVLLTLAVIGVVAALTIPAVITKVTRDQYVVALKKAYNTLKSIEHKAVREHGPMTNWNWKNTQEDFETYFESYFDTMKECGNTRDEGCFVTVYTYLDGSEWDLNLNTTSRYKFVTSDGIALAYIAEQDEKVAGKFWIDVNGQKGPNKYGRDLFNFYVIPELGIKPHGAYGVDGKSLSSAEVDKKCPATGAYCAAKVLSEGAMNY